MGNDIEESRRQMSVGESIRRSFERVVSSSGVKQRRPSAVSLPTEGESQSDESDDTINVWHLLRRPVVMIMSLLFLCVNIGNGIIIWYPKIAILLGGGSTLEFGGTIAARIAGALGMILAAFAAQVNVVRSLVVTSFMSMVFAIGIAGTLLGNTAWGLAVTYTLWYMVNDMTYALKYCVAPQVFDAEVRTSSFGLATGIGKLGFCFAPYLVLAASGNLKSEVAFFPVVLAHAAFWGIAGGLALLLVRYVHPPVSKLDD